MRSLTKLPLPSRWVLGSHGRPRRRHSVTVREQGSVGRGTRTTGRVTYAIDEAPAGISSHTRPALVHRVSVPFVLALTRETAAVYGTLQEARAVNFLGRASSPLRTWLSSLPDPRISAELGYQDDSHRAGCKSIRPDSTCDRRSPAYCATRGMRDCYAALR